MTTRTTELAPPDADGAGSALEVLVRAADAGPTYLTWRWLDGTAEPFFHVIGPVDFSPLAARLTEALIAALPGEEPDESARRALVTGAFADRGEELRLSKDLGALVLPAPFWERLLRESRHRPVTLRITPSRALARVPWELMVAPDGRRLVQIATLVYEAPSTVHYQRALLPQPFDTHSDKPLRTLDPAIPEGARLGPVLYRYSRNYLRDQLELDNEATERKEISRADLGKLLRAKDKPTRWLHVGHVSADDEQPGSAALHLSDSQDWHGWARAVGSHKPFTARDLHLGTVDVEVRQPGLRYPATGNVVGADIWPMPGRVAIIACDSGADHAASETFGLVVTALISGAEYVTSTRWTVPTDEAFRRTHDRFESLPASDLIVAVDRAHTKAYPIAALREWQLAKLARWQTQGSIVDSPILFAGITTHHAPARPELRSLAGPDGPVTAAG
jgi:hypothetical protein